MSQPWRHATLLLALLASALWAGAKVEFDTHSFECGELLEGHNDVIRARFVFKNGGDAPLTIDNIRPSCSCLKLSFPRQLAPGKSGVITAVASVKGYPNGPLTKSLLVESNAANEARARLTINATVQSLIDVSHGFVRLDGSKPDSALQIFLASKKTDLQVLQIGFRETDKQGLWDVLTGKALPVKFTWSPTDSTRTDGYRVYRLSLFAPRVNSPLTGTFSLKTNHPQKPRLALAGKISR